MEQGTTDQPLWLDEVEIGAFDTSEIEEVLDVLARGMRDNPLAVATFGDDPGRRRRGLRRVLSAAFSARDFSHTLLARREGGEIVGVCAMTPPGHCLPTRREKLRMAVSNGPLTMLRTMRWLGAWEGHEPEGRHWHLGPVAVDGHLQGTGVGSLLMRVLCAQMDAACEDAYLETYEPEDVGFYEGFGFEVVGEEDVLGATIYSMLRRAKVRYARRGAPQEFSKGSPS